MASPAQLNYQRKAAARAAAKAGPGEDMASAACNEYELMLAKLRQDRQRLHQVQSMERRAEVKREILPSYAPYVNGVLAAGRGAQDLILTSVMVWRLDAGDFAGGLDIAAYVLLHGLSLPDQYSRSAAALLVDEVSDHALKAIQSREPFDTEALQRVAVLTADFDMHDQVRAKLFKAQGLVLADEDPAEAVSLLRRALELNKNVGVKKDIERLETRLRNGEGDKGPSSETNTNSSEERNPPAPPGN